MLIDTHQTDTLEIDLHATQWQSSPQSILLLYIVEVCLKYQPNKYTCTSKVIFTDLGHSHTYIYIKYDLSDIEKP